MTPTPNPSLKDPDASQARKWSNHSLNALAILSIVFMLASFFQVFKQYYAHRPAEQEVSRQRLFDKPVSKPRQGLDDLIPDQRLREEVQQIERRLREARKEKKLALAELQDSPTTDPNRHYAARRQGIEDTLQSLGPEQPGLAAPLLEQLEQVEVDAPISRD